MNGYLKQSTASQVRTIGPFVDDGDFVTLENALTINAADILLKKNGAASASKNSGGATADGSGGLYAVTWDATDTATVGELSVSVKVAGALVYFCTYTVLEEAVYDMLFAASATGFISDTTRASQTSVNTLATYVDTEVAAIKVATDNLTNDFANVNAWLTSIYGAVDTEVAAIKAKTDNLPSDPADASDIAASFATVNATLASMSTSLELDATDLNAIADALLKRDWTSVSGEAAYSALNAFRMLRNVWNTTGGTLSVKKEDGTTNAWTRTLTTDASADPITGAT